MAEDKAIKVCTICGVPKTLEDNFAKHPKTKDGYEGQCHTCRSKQKKDREQAKKDGTWKDRRKIRQKDSETTKRIKKAKKEFQIIDSNKRGDMVVTVDFKDYPEAYEALEKAARENVRSMAEQLIASFIDK